MHEKHSSTERVRDASVLRTPVDKPSVLIAEDDFFIREGFLCPLLAPHFNIVAAVSDGWEAVHAAGLHRPDIVLLDVSLPTLRGFQAARQILAFQPQCKVIFVTNYAETEYVEAANALGASGYVLKSRATEELLDAIRTALDGCFYRPAL